MNERTGDIFDHLSKEEPDYLLITTNSYIKNNGSLAMGKGIAGQAVKKWPTLSSIFGQQVKAKCGHLGIYHLIMGGIDEKLKLKIWGFQTKTHYYQHSDPILIKDGIRVLATIAQLTPNEIFWLPFPGIGYGRLKKEEVISSLEELPENIIIWTKNDVYL